ncbi:MAG: cell division protein FtsH, partial [Phyllobacteriaceae bacterium]|nr:cell division protein FtsH [Phyllobacteriaceae bacterium]
MNANLRNFAIWVIVGLLVIALFQLFQNPGRGGGSNEIAFSQFLDDVEGGKVKQVTITDQQITGAYKAQGTFQTYAPPGANVVEELRKKDVAIVARPAGENFSLIGALISWMPMIVIIGIWLFVMRQMQGGAGGKAMGFGKSKAKLLTEAHGRVTFEDVAGIDEAKEDLQEIVEFLRDPQKFQRLGGRIPRGVLLVGPPGTG